MQTQAPQTYPALAQAAREARGKDWPAAERLAAELRERFPEQPAGYQIGVAAARVLRRYDDAMTLQREAAERFPSRSWPLTEAALTAHSQGEIDAALALTTALRYRFPTNPTGWKLGAQLLRLRNRTIEAIAVLRDATERFPAENWPICEIAQVTTRQARQDRMDVLLAHLTRTHASPAPVRPDVVGVLGMHRSGTSLCTAMLQHLGARLGGPLLPANAYNPEGYQEHVEVVNTHQALLLALGLDWDSSHLSDPIPLGFWKGPAMAAARARLDQLLTQETEGEDRPRKRPWAFKDPRTPHFLPLWHQLLAERNMRPAWVLSVRHPAAVAASLAARDRMPPQISGLLWLEHNLEALRHAGDNLAALVHYEDWFTDPLAQVRRLAQALGGAEEEAIQAAAATVRPDLRHDSTLDLTGLPPLALELYARLRTARAEDGAALRREAAALWEQLSGMARTAGPPSVRTEADTVRDVQPLEGHEILWPQGVDAAVAYEAGETVLLVCPDPSARLIRATPCHDGIWGTAWHVPLPDGPASVTVTFAAGQVTLTTGLGAASLPWSPVAPVRLRCPAAVELRLVVELKGVASAPVSGDVPQRTTLPAQLDSGTPWAGWLEQADPAQGLVGWIARPGASAGGVRVEAICRGRRIALAHAHPIPRPTGVNRFRIGWHRFDAARVTRLVSTHPDAPVQVMLSEAGGLLPAASPAPTIAQIASHIATAPAPDPRDHYGAIADAGVFDAAWYRRTYDPPGDPLAHYLAEGEARGYQPCLYLEPWRVAVDLELPSLEGALAAYLRDPLKVAVPGLHFHQAWFRGICPELPGQSPLARLLEQRRKVSPNPFFDLPGWLARHDGLAAAEDPYAHFLASPEGAACEQRLVQALRRPLPHAVSPQGRVSVVLPSYNYARYLPVRLASIMGQTAPLREVIVLDDASTDRSVALAEAMAVQSGWPLRLVVNQRNGGNAFRQWHAGLARASGEMVWIAEADDVATPTLVERLAACLDADPTALFAFFDPAVVDAAGNQVAADNRAYYARLGDGGLARSDVFTARDFLARFLCPRNLVLNASAVLWRRSALERAFAALGEEAFSLTCAGDWQLYVAACGLGGTVHYIAEPLGSHRRHPGSVTSTLEKERHFAEIQRVHALVAPLLMDHEAGRAAMHQYNSMLQRAWGLGQDAAAG